MRMKMSFKSQYIMSLFDQVSKDIVAAMKAKDKVRLEALRNIKKFFIEAKTAPGANDTLDDAVALKILAKLAKQGRDTAALYHEQNRPDLAEEEEAQAKVIEEYLPKALTPEELEAEVKAIIAQVGATSAKDMGKVMGVASKQLAGRADGRAISTLVKQLLA
jgi:yqeY family protein